MAAVIFDFDGTVVDSLEAVAEIIYAMTNQKYKLDKNDILALRSKSVRAIAKEFNIPSWRVAFMLTKGRKMMSDYITELEPTPGIIDVIETLNKQGHRLYIVSSNSSDNIDLFLKNYRIKSLFLEVVGGNSLFGKAKIIAKIIHQQNKQNKPYFYIGDEVRDIEAAKKAGIKAIAVTWGFAQPDQLEAAKPFAIAKKPEQLIEIINKHITSN